MSDQSFFMTQGRISHPGKYEALYSDLPSDIESLCRIVQGTTLHVFWAARYGLDLSPERQSEVQLRSMEKRLEHMIELDNRPLVEPRKLEQKEIGNCRDHSLMLVSMLRHQGIAARARCGFGTYFIPNHYEDHWVAEYWDDSRGCWILVDPQLDEFQCRELGVTFNPLDVPRDQFIVAGKAWNLYRSGSADPDTFGIFDMHGPAFILGNLLRDLASLNKVELLPWDCWGLILDYAMNRTEFRKEDSGLLDHVASLIEADVPDFDQVEKLYQTDERLRVGKTIQSYIDDSCVEVTI